MFLEAESFKEHLFLIGALARHVCEIGRAKKYLFSTLKCSQLNSLHVLYLQTCFLTIFNVT